MNHSTAPKTIKSTFWFIELDDNANPSLIKWLPENTIIFQSATNIFLDAQWMKEGDTICSILHQDNATPSWIEDHTTITLNTSGALTINDAIIPFHMKTSFREECIDFEMTCENISIDEDISIAFPILSLSTTPTDQLLIPASFGNSIPLNQDQSFMAVYPSYHAVAEFFLHVKSDVSLLFQSSASKNEMKKFLITHKQADSLLRQSIEFYPPYYGANILKASASLSLVKGGLKESIKYFRKQQSGSINDQNDETNSTPTLRVESSIDDIMLWIDIDAKEMLHSIDWLFNISRVIDAKIGLIVRSWHAPKGDEMYPDYFPMEIPYRDLKNSLKELTAAGVYTFPYVNGRLCDERTRFWADMNARDCAVITRDDTLVEEYYANKYPSVVMCPGAKVWQTQLSQTASRLAELGFSGIYLDNFLASYPQRCFSKKHDHAPGDTMGWTKGINSCLKGIKTAGSEINPDFSIVTEDCTDVYCENIDTAMIFLGATISRWNQQIDLHDQLPAPIFTGLFADRLNTFCRYILPYDIANTHEFCIKIAHQALSGCQIGVISSHHLRLMEGDEVKHHPLHRITHCLRNITSTHSSWQQKVLSLKTLFSRDRPPIVGSWKIEFLKNIMLLRQTILSHAVDKVWSNYNLVTCDTKVDFVSKYAFDNFPTLTKRAKHQSIMSSEWITAEGILVPVINIRDQKSDGYLRLNMEEFFPENKSEWKADMHDVNDGLMSRNPFQDSKIQLDISMKPLQICYLRIYRS